MLPIRRLSPCCRGLHISAFPLRPTPARTRLPPTQSLTSFQILTVQRFTFHSSIYSRAVSTTSRTSCDAVGKIQSTHYHLVYTCKVPLFVPPIYKHCYCCFYKRKLCWNILSFSISHVRLYTCARFRRFAPPGPSRRFPNTLTTKVW